MLVDFLTFFVALVTLLAAAKYFTEAAEVIGTWMRLPPFVIGIFIVGIGTSLPELISGVLSVQHGLSEIVPGNIIGANISNLLLITGLAVVLNKKNIILLSDYLYIDLHFLLGSFVYFAMIAYDGTIVFSEAIIGIFIFIIYSIYLIKGESKTSNELLVDKSLREKFPIKHLGIIVVTAIGIFYGANYTVQSLEHLANALAIPPAIIALTVLSIGTTLPELAVNITAIRKGKAELAMGNVLGSCVFNTLVIPSGAGLFGTITVPHSLLIFSLPMMGASGLLFYLLTQDKKISVWEGLLFLCLYVLFIFKVASGV